MCRDYNQLVFNHFVVFAADGTIFGSARENGHIHNFLIRRESIRTQQGEQWLELDPEIAHLVRTRVQDAYAKVPIYRTKRYILD